MTALPPRHIPVLGREVHGLRESVFVACFDNEVTWLSLGTHGKCTDQELERLRTAKVE